jgi:hypothetical protein
MPVQPGAQFEQLPMFMSGREITQQYAPAEDDKHWINSKQRFENSDELWGRKAQESETGGHGGRSYRLNSGELGTLHESIKENGVQSPIPLGRTQVIDGHHRVASQFAIDPDKQIPVTHREGGLLELRAEKVESEKRYAEQHRAQMRANYEADKPSADERAEYLRANPTAARLRG